MGAEEFNLDAVEQSFTAYKVGSVVKGTVARKTEKGLVVNIGGKADGFIDASETEFMDLATGTEIDVMIKDSKINDGLVAVSAARAVGMVAGGVNLTELKPGVTFDAIVDGANKAGLSCYYGPHKVFVPAREVDEFFVRDLDAYKGKTLTLVATDINEDRKEVVASRKLVLMEGKQKASETFWAGIFPNKLVTGRVVRITNFGAFVNVDGVDCLVHNSETTYDRSKTAQDVFEIGNEYKFRVIAADRDTGKVQLSHKATAAHPFDDKATELQPNTEYKVTITKLLPYGALAKLPNGLEGMIHISEMSNDYVQAVTEICHVGDEKTARVIGVDMEKRKIALTLKSE